MKMTSIPPTRENPSENFVAFPSIFFSLHMNTVYIGICLSVAETMQILQDYHGFSATFPVSGLLFLCLGPMPAPVIPWTPLGHPSTLVSSETVPADQPYRVVVTTLL